MLPLYNIASVEGAALIELSKLFVGANQAWYVSGCGLDLESEASWVSTGQPGKTNLSNFFWSPKKVLLVEGIPT